MSGLRTRAYQACTLGTAATKTLAVRTAPSTHGITIAEITISAASIDATQKVPLYSLTLSSSLSGGTPGTAGTISKDPNFSDDISAGSTKVGTVGGDYSSEPTFGTEYTIYGSYIEPRGVGAVIRIPGGLRVPPGYTLTVKVNNTSGTSSNAAVLFVEDI